LGELPGGRGGQLGGSPKLSPFWLVRGGGPGVAGLFVETHPDPEQRLKRRTEFLALAACASSWRPWYRSTAGQARRLPSRIASEPAKTIATQVNEKSNSVQTLTSAPGCPRSCREPRVGFARPSAFRRGPH